MCRFQCTPVYARVRQVRHTASYEPPTTHADDAEVFPQCPTRQDGSIAPLQPAQLNPPLWSKSPAVQRSSGRNIMRGVRLRVCMQKMNHLSLTNVHHHADQVRVQVGSGEGPGLPPRPALGGGLAAQWRHPAVSILLGGPFGGIEMVFGRALDGSGAPRRIWYCFYVWTGGRDTGQSQAVE